MSPVDYAHDGALDAAALARQLGLDPAQTTSLTFEPSLLDPTRGRLTWYGVREMPVAEFEAAVQAARA